MIQRTDEVCADPRCGRPLDRGDARMVVVTKLARAWDDEKYRRQGFTEANECFSELQVGKTLSFCSSFHAARTLLFEPW